MQNMLRMIGCVENIGSGFPKILSAWKKAGWSEPVLENKLDLQEVQLTLFVPKWSEQVNVAEDVVHKLTERQANIYEFIKEGVAVNTKYLSEKRVV